jgi:hypothetical protein
MKRVEIDRGREKQREGGMATEGRRLRENTLGKWRLETRGGWPENKSGRLVRTRQNV